MVDTLYGKLRVGPRKPAMFHYVSLCFTHLPPSSWQGRQLGIKTNFAIRHQLSPPRGQRALRPAECMTKRRTTPAPSSCSLGTPLGKPWGNPDVMGSSWEFHGNFMGSAWEFHGNFMNKGMNGGDFIGIS